MMRISLTSVFLFCSAFVFSQTKDAGLWMDVGLSRELGEHFELSVSPEIRLDENISRWSRLFGDVSLEYKYNKHLSLSAAYRGGAGNDGVHIDGRHRMQYGLGVKQKWEDWTFQYQSRVQFALNAAWSDADVDFNTTWRNRVTIKNNGLKKIDLSTSFESFNAISAYQDLVLTNWRWMSQVSRKINKGQSAAVGYLIQRDLTESPQHLDFVILLSYKVEL